MSRTRTWVAGPAPSLARSAACAPGASLPRTVDSCAAAAGSELSIPTGSSWGSPAQPTARSAVRGRSAVTCRFLMAENSLFLVEADRSRAALELEQAEAARHR